MSKNTVVEFSGRETFSDALNELLQSGAQQLISQAMECELQIFLSQLASRKTDTGLAAIVRNGHQPERQIQTGIGPVTVKVPKVRSRDGTPVTFRALLQLRSSSRMMEYGRA